MHIYLYIHTCIYTCIYTHVYIYIYIHIYIHILVWPRAYPCTEVWLMDDSGCELCGLDETFRILIRIMLELELDRSMWSSKSSNAIHP